MKKSRKVAALVLLFVGIVICWHAWRSQTRYILKRLNLSNVESISVYSLDLRNEAELSETEAFAVICQLNKVELVGKGTQQYTEYTGRHCPMFHIKLKNGKEIDFGESSPFYNINTEEFGFPLKEKKKTFGYRVADTHEEYILGETIGATYWYLREKYFPPKERIFTPSTEP